MKLSNWMKHARSKFTRRNIILGGSALLVAAFAAMAVSGVFNPTTPVTLPQGTTISVRLDHALASDTHASGDSFDATVYQPVVLNGKTALPDGTRARGHVVEAREAGRLQTPALLTLALDEVEVGGEWYKVETAITRRRGPSHKKRNWLFIGGGAAGGALLGGLFGGGKGAAIGAGVGAGSGTAAAAATGKKEIRLPAETPLTFRLTDPVTVEVPVKQAEKQVAISRQR